MQSALIELDSLRESYSTQIADIFNYRYADVDTAATRAAWLYDLGPDAAAEFRSNPCQLFTDVLQLFRTAFVGLETGLRNHTTQAEPAASLAAAWRVVSPAFPEDASVSDSVIANSVIADGIVAAFRAIGVAPADFDEDLKNANRLCTLFSAHLLVPYVLLAVLALVMTSALMRSLAAILSALVLTVNMLLASASTADEE